MAGKLPSVRLKSSSEDEVPPSPPLRMLSQAESLPDLMDSEQLRNPKRGRNPSSSPPANRTKFLSTYDSHDKLSSKETSSQLNIASVKPKMSSNLPSKTMKAEVHPPPRGNSSRGNRDHKGSQNRPSISRLPKEDKKQAHIS